MEVAIRRREQEVWQACDDLWALSGDIKSITGDEIRDRLVVLGKSRGSPNEIYKYRKTWQISRGLAEGDLRTEAHDDPITRAARLVHEQLKCEADQKIDALKREFEEQSAEKDRAVAQAKHAVTQVMTEFSQLEHKHKQTSAEKQTLEQQLFAEIDLRKAIEKEVALNKALLEQERLHADNRVQEIRNIFSQETLAHKAREHTLNARVDALIEDAKQKGIEYSEQLMALKTTIVNREIEIDRAEKKSARAEKTITALHDEIASHQAQLHRANDAYAKLQSELAVTAKEVVIAREELRCLREHHQKLTRMLTRSEHTVARLRTIIARGNMADARA